jgi:hypothetical protein
MKRNKTLLILIQLLLFGSNLFAQTETTNIRFINTGAMNVNGTMYVQGDMQMTNVAGISQDVVVLHDGTTALEGSFYHDALKNVFKTVNNGGKTKTQPKGITSSTGTIKFVTNNTGKTRYISTQSTSFDRATEYIAFPNLVIDTDDTIQVPEYLGLDARTLVRNSGKDGVLYLHSHLLKDANNESDIYDASFRVTGNGGSYTVTPGAVIVEKYVKEFREVAEGSPSASHQMPFASPFENMRSGYFAGNWVRRPLFDDNASSFLYPYGNEDKNGDGFIDFDQYVIDPKEDLNTREAYILRLQRHGAGEDKEYANLLHTAGEDHNKAEFIIHGAPYPSLGDRPEPKQLFVGKSVLSRTPKTNKSATQNWLIGNSYTSALDANAIAKDLMDGHVPFSTSMYIYHHGSTGYETYDMYNNGGTIDIPPIHAMSIFMIAVWKNNTVSETIEIGSQYQIHARGLMGKHGKDPNKPLRNETSSDVLTFTMNPQDNHFIYDRTAIRFSEEAQLGMDEQDLAKLINKSNRLFQLYGNNGSSSELQQNALPYGAKEARLNVNPPAAEIPCVLSVEDAYAVNTEEVLLYDTQLNLLRDLRVSDSYTFISSPEDNPERFIVYFVPQEMTGIDSPKTGWYHWNNKQTLTVKDIDESLISSPISIYASTGVMVINQTAGNQETEIDIQSLPYGVYILSLGGKTIKFIK